jgi:hypothetical protein
MDGSRCPFKADTVPTHRRGAAIFADRFPLPRTEETPADQAGPAVDSQAHLSVMHNL